MDSKRNLHFTIINQHIRFAVAASTSRNCICVGGRIDAVENAKKTRRLAYTWRWEDAYPLHHGFTIGLCNALVD